MRSSASRAVAAVVLAAALVLTVLAAAASATVTQRPPAGGPDPKPMVLLRSDLGGAKVTAQGYYRDRDFPSVISYQREFEDARVGGTRLLGVNSEAEIGTTAQTTSSFIKEFRRFVSSKQGRKLVADAISEAIPAGDTVSLVRIGRPRALGVGKDSFDMLLTFNVLGLLRFDSHVAVFRVDRVLGLLFLVGEPAERVPLSVVKRLARVMVGRMDVELTPRNVTLPTISGAPAVGQTVTATRGTWRGGPTSFAFQWQRCDATGGACVAIPGATVDRYAITDADAGATLRAVVDARNTHAAGSAVSAPTVVVPATGPPVSTAPPTISGNAQVGQTLTAGSGAWTGAPTTFAYRWQRCDAGGAACVDIPGATAATYLLTSAEAGSTIRVAVTARNVVGEATAVSAPTAVVT
jgi:hypothetical protein